MFSASDGIYAEPAIAADGTIYVGSVDSNLYAIQGCNGAQKWMFHTGGPIVSAVAIGANGMIYFGCEDFKVYALDASSGALRWASPTQGKVNSSPAIGADGTIYIASYDQRIYAFDGSTGARKWSFLTGSDVSNSPALGTNGLVYIPSDDGNMYALDAKSGKQVWAVQPYQGYIGGSSAAIGGDGTVYAGANNAVIAIDGATGNTHWVYKVTNHFVSSTPSLSANGVLYVGSKGPRRNNSIDLMSSGQWCSSSRRGSRDA